jgi:hypothetical protein
MVANTQTQANILGAAIVELLNGKLTDETIAAVDTINRDDVPEPLNTMVGYMHGMSTHEPLRESQITSLLEEIRGMATEALEARVQHPSPISTEWTTLYTVLGAMLDGGDYDLRGTADIMAEAGLELVNPDRVPEWARPLAEHINTSTTQGDELNLELLDILEAQIQKRRAELR